MVLLSKIQKFEKTALSWFYGMFDAMARAETLKQFLHNYL
ncbi:hypothetical protein NSP_25470 [Nodularia spumigena CCY9414]|nr:hypothetical protein NSP_25470 [Nodularia spumigena CCY9414]